MRIGLIIGYVAITLLYCGCGTIKDIDSPNYRQIRSKVILGEIGTYKDGLLVDDFKPVGTPNLSRPLRLSINEKYFSKRGYKKFQMRSGKQQFKVNDSLFEEMRPVYFEIEIADKVSYIESINQSQEGQLLNYLLRTEDNLAVTGIKITYSELLKDKLKRATEVYLVDLNGLTYGFKLINSDNASEIINMSEGTGMEYIFSSICWTKNYKGDYLVGALIKPGDFCPGETKNKAKKLYEKDIFEKL